MPIYAKAGANFTPAPAGSHASVCVDVVDLGNITVEYSGKAKTQHKIRIVWQIEELRDDGNPFSLRKQYTLSLHEKSSLRKDLESWRGRSFTEDELRGFDVEVLIGKGALLSVIHKDSNGTTYANVTGVMKLPKGMAAPTPVSYVRECDRQPAESAAVPEYNGPSIDDTDIPF
jgi:hypothetical protein